MEPTYRIAEKMHDDLLEQLLHNRSIPPEKREAFLSPDYEKHINDPFSMTDMDSAVERVMYARSNDEKIAIFSDYDCDGIPAGTLMHDFFKKIGITNFSNHIPHRHYDGFGLNEQSVRTFIKNDVKLIITLDCGTVSFKEIDLARENNIDVIVIDHHEPDPLKLPNAYAILNPKRDTAYPFRELCATGVAFKFVQAFLQREHEKGNPMNIPPGWEKWLLDLVAIATISDMVPLLDENRIFVKYGLLVLRKSRRPGLQKLLRINRINTSFLSEDDIGFTIAPHINAASRMDTPEIGFTLLAGNDEEGSEAAEKLGKLNTTRKGVVASMTREAYEKLSKKDHTPPVIVLGNPEWKPSLVGLVANTLAEKYGRPAFVWGRDGNGVIKGSCRSSSVSVMDLMLSVKESFLHFGGHHGAGGFEVSDHAIHTLSETLESAYRIYEAQPTPLQAGRMVDALIHSDSVNDDLYRTVSLLMPFGMKNTKPLFQITHVTPEKITLFGKAKEHTKITFKNNHETLQAIAFFKKPEDFCSTPQEGLSCTLIAHVEQSYFMNRLERRLRIIDVLV